MKSSGRVMRRTMISGLLVLVVLTLAVSSYGQVCTPPPSGMVSWWPGDGNANDIVGTNNGTLLGGTSFSAAKVGLGFTFSSDSDGVTVADNPNLNVNSPGFTADFWMKGIKNQPDPSLSTILEKSHGWVDGTGWAFQVFTANGLLTFNIGNGTAFPGVVGAVDVLDGNFHHVAGTWDGTTILLYVDGTLQGTAALSSPANNSRPVNMGFTWGGGTPRRFFRGTLDEVELFNRALSPTEIGAIHAADSGGKCKPGRRAYVANARSSSISVIDTSTDAVVATVVVGANPVHVAIAPNGAAYVTNAGANSVSVINTATNTVVATVPVGAHPVDVAVTPDGTKAYVTNAGANTVSVINTSTNTVIATVTVGPNPVSVAFTPDGTKAYVTNAGANSVSVISTAMNAVIATVPVGLNPVNIVLH